LYVGSVNVPLGAGDAVTAALVGGGLEAAVVGGALGVGVTVAVAVTAAGTNAVVIGD
jgi:hypothetical protein